MTLHARRLAKLEAAFMSRGRPFVIWGMNDALELKSDAEISAEIAAARAASHMASIDEAVIVTWRPA